MWTDVATISYSTAALAYFFLSVLLLTSWRGRFYGMLLSMACLISSVWAAIIVININWSLSLITLTNFFEIFRSAGWTVFLIALIGPFQKRLRETHIPRIRRPFAGVLLVYVLLMCNVFLVTYEDSLVSGLPVNTLTGIAGNVIIAIIGIILIEQFYRNSQPEKRWAIKFICLGIGAIFVYDFYLYSDALLFRNINPELWSARGFVNALVVPFIAISAARNPKWAVGISVSRQIIFYSAALLGTATYLLLMAAAGYYLRFSGGSWGIVLQMSFLFGSILLLIGILFSGTIRSWLKVFISKHFYSYNYDYREEWLRFTATLAENKGELKGRVIQSLAQLVESPGGSLWIRQESEHFIPVHHWNMPIIKGMETAGSSLCHFLEEKEWVIDLKEYQQSVELYSPLVIPKWLQTMPEARFVIPLILEEKLFGFIVLIHPRSAIKLNWEIRDILKIAGKQAVSYLAQEEASRALMIARQFESFNRMSTFVVHDLKNLIFQLSLMLSNAEKHKSNPEFQEDMVQTVNLSVGKMKRLLEKLSKGSSLAQTDTILLNRLLAEIVDSKVIFEPTPVFESCDEEIYVAADKARLGRVISHIVQNAIEATSKNGSVTVRLYNRQGQVVIEVQDTGHGMSEEFVQERLFKPFETTKSAGMGIGVFESREYIQELGGKLEVTTQESVGTTFYILLEPADAHDTPDI